MPILLSLFIAGLCAFLIIGLYVLLLNPGNKINQTFFLFSLCYIISSILSILVQLSEDLHQISFYYRIGTSSAVVAYALILLLSIYISNIIEFKKIYLPVFFLIPAYLTYRNLTIPRFVKFVKYNDTWRTTAIEDPFNFFLVIAFCLLSTLAYVAIMLYWRR